MVHRLQADLDTLVEASVCARRAVLLGDEGVARQALADAQDALTALQGALAPEPPMTALDEAERRLEANGERL